MSNTDGPSGTLEITPEIGSENKNEIPPNLNETLTNINMNMSSMTELLKKFVQGSVNAPIGHTYEGPTGSSNIDLPTGFEIMSTRQPNLPTGHSEMLSTGQNLPSPTGSYDSLLIATGAKRRKDDESEEPPAKLARDNEPNPNDDILSIHPDEDELDLVGKPDFLEELGEAFETSDNVTDNINEKLAAFVDKRWGQKIKPEKLKSLIKNYKRPKNCPKMHQIKVNKGAWDNLKLEKKQADIRLSNMQQTITKIGCLTLQSANFLLENKNSFQDDIGVNNHIMMSYHAIALGHLIADLSNMRRGYLKNALRPEFQALCSASTEIPHSSYLFGDDFGKQIKEVEETNKITKAFKPVSLKPRETVFSNFRNPNQIGGSSGGFPRFGNRRDFLWQGPRPQGFRKKVWNHPSNTQSKSPQRFTRPQQKY